ncbi:dynamin family protein [Saccharibacillus brassicae]|uniref:dynamin family protein n=1 Tax=Saccharibacillus brassicae TaxID=2583377 RepID=UPI001478B924|nr:dynamin family protein [Saccharibacillus brassicae]
MKGILEKHKEVASYLDITSDIHFLNQLIKQIESETFYIPVIGQYSAGKTSFLNALFKVDYLPTRGTETTSFATFIAYGEHDHALVEYRDGNMKEITIEELSLYRHGESNPELVNIKALHLKIKDPILKTGAIFVDTPGLNTLAQHHEETTLNVIAQANFLIYVMGKSLTDYDLKLFRQVEENGIDLILIRTKLDEVKSSEENLEELILQEKKKVQQELGASLCWFGISTYPEWLQQPSWSRRLNEIGNYLKYDVAAKMGQIKERYIQHQLTSLTSEWVKQLEEKKATAQAATRLEEQQIQKQINYLEEQALKQERTMLENSRDIHNHLVTFSSQVISKITYLKNEASESFENKMMRLPDLHAMQQQAQTLATKEIGIYLSEVKSMCQAYSHKMIEEGYRKAGVELHEISEEINDSLNLEFCPELELPSPEQLDRSGQRKVEELTEALESLNEALHYDELELSELNQNKEKLRSTLNKSKQAVVEVKGELEKLGSFDAPMKWIEGDKKASETMKKLGSVLDMLTVFIPTTAPIKLAGQAGKITKTMQIAAKASEVAKTAQTLNQGFEIVEEMMQHKKNQKGSQVHPKSPGLSFVNKGTALDIIKSISLEYWFEKTGNLFDTPSYYEIDREAHESYSKQKKRLEDRQHEAIHQQMIALQSNSLIHNQESKLKRRQEINTKTQKALARQLEAASEQAKKDGRMNYSLQLKILFEQEIQRLNQTLLPQIEKFYKDRANMIVLEAMAGVQKRIDDLKKMLSQTLVDKNKAHEQIEQSLAQCNDYLNWIRNLEVKA